MPFCISFLIYNMMYLKKKKKTITLEERIHWFEFQLLTLPCFSVPEWPYCFAQCLKPNLSFTLNISLLSTFSSCIFPILLNFSQIHLLLLTTPPSFGYNDLSSKMAQMFSNLWHHKIGCGAFCGRTCHPHCISCLLMPNKFSHTSQLKATQFVISQGVWVKNQVWFSWLLGFRGFYNTKIKMFHLKVQWGKDLCPRPCSCWQDFFWVVGRRALDPR